MKNLKISTKIWFGFSYILVFLLAITTITLISSLRTGSNIDQIDVYGSMENSANELIHIVNETRVTAAVFYETHSQASYSDLTKQLMYCDYRLGKLFENIGAHPELAAFRGDIDSFSTLYTRWRDGTKSLAGSYDLDAPFDEQDAEAFASAANGLRSICLQAHEVLSNTIDRAGEISGRKMAETTSFHTVALVIVSVVSVVALVSAVALSIITSRSISPPISNMRNVLSQIGQTGDLQIPDDMQEKLGISARGRDETAQCAQALLVLVDRLHKIDRLLELVAGGDLTAELELQSRRDTMGLAVDTVLKNLNQKFGMIAQSTGWVRQKAEELSDGSTLLADGSKAQAASVEDLSGSVSQIVEKIKRNTELAGQAAQMVDDIQQNAKSGTEQMTRMTQAARDINDASRSIAKVIKVIDDIAFQTNILALNAAVEAARAGQHGKGFSVVAEEVRSLATKSAEAAKDTGVMIENTIQKATLGADIAAATSQSLEKIVHGVHQSSSLIGEITSLSQEQSVDIRQIITGVEHVAMIVEQNTSIASQSADATGEISEQSGVLSELVGQFRLLDSEPSGSYQISGRY